MIVALNLFVQMKHKKSMGTRTGGNRSILTLCKKRPFACDIVVLRKYVGHM